MNTLTTKTHFYVRPAGPDGTARQEFVRLQPGAVLRPMGVDWQPGMPWQTAPQQVYRVGIDAGVDDEGTDWSGRKAFATMGRFTDALVESRQSDAPSWNWVR